MDEGLRAIWRRRTIVAGIALLGPSGCSREPQAQARLPTAAEVSPESVLVNYAPTRLRLLPDRASDGRGRYVVMASERPGLVAAWRPLAVVDRTPPSGYRARAGELAWLSGRAILGALAGAGAGQEGARPELRIYDRDGKTFVAAPVPLPAPCTTDRPPLLQVTGVRVRGVVRCPAQDRAYLLWADLTGVLPGVMVVPGMGRVELLLSADGADYLLGGRKVVRVAEGGAQTIGAVPPSGAPDDSGETLALLRRGDELLVVEGVVGRVVRMDASRLSWRGEGRFPAGSRTVRLRAAEAGDHLIIVTAERAPSPEVAGTELFGTSVALSDGGGPPRPGPRLMLGAGPPVSDHDLASVAADATHPQAGALMVRTHAGNTGPLVALSRLHF